MLLAEAVKLHGQDVLDHLDLDAEVPTISRFATQGDVSVLKVTTKPATTPIPADGVVIVRSEVSSNTHSFHGGGFFDYAKPKAGSLTLGTLTVEKDAELPTLLHHPEHGDYLIAPGTYRVGSQRQFAGEWVRVAD